MLENIIIYILAVSLLFLGVLFIFWLIDIIFLGASLW